MAYFLAVDGGGTKTDCAVAEGTRILGRATAGTSKIHSVGRQAARESLLEGVREALKAAGCQGKNVAGSCVGIAGASHPDVVEWVKATLGEVISGRIEVVGDNVIAHEAAFQGSAGVLVIAGTGSIAYGRNASGESARSGGWGAVISDEGSGRWIGRTAVSAVMRAFDSGRVTELQPRFLRAWLVESREEVVRLANSNPAPNFSELFPEVLKAAEAGDLVAKEVLAAAGCELAELALAVSGRLWQMEDPVTVCGTGGVLDNAKDVRQALRSALQTRRPSAKYDEKPVDPIVGALFLAQKSGS